MEPISAQRRREIIDALRRGTVPQRGLDVFAVGLERFEPALDDELRAVAEGGAGFKAIRGEYGSGKTFFARWLQERAKRPGFAAAEVQISEAETPLHRLETVYRRAMERLSTADALQGAFRPVVDGWFYGLEEEVLAEGRVDPARRGGPGGGDRGAAGEAAVGDQPGHAPVRPGACGATAGPGPTGDAATADGPDRLAGGPAARRRRGQAGGRDQGRGRPLRRPELPPGPADGPARLGLRRAGPGARRDRDLAAGPRRRPREGAQRPAPARRRGRRRPVPRPLPGHHRHAGLLRRPAGRPPAGAAGPAAARRLPDRRPVRQPACRPGPPARLHPRPAGRGRPHDPRPLRPRRRGPRPDPGPGRRRLRRRAGRRRRRRPRAARSGSPPGCSSRSWSATCSTASTSTPTSTRGGTTA